MKKPLSILLPTFNGAMHLRDCVNSILAQTFEDFELLIVDDCSTDSTIEIVNEYAAQDSRIRILQNAHNLGLVSNWQRCIEQSSGDWLKFAFQDDLLAPSCISELLAAASNAGCPISACKRSLKLEQGVEEGLETFLVQVPSVDDIFGKVEFISASAVADLAVERLDLNVFGEPTAFLLHRDCFTRYGAFISRLRQSCDYEFWVRVGSNTGIAYVSEPLATFRVHPQSTSSSNIRVKHFLTTFADPLILLNEYLSRPYYANLRARAAVHSREYRLERQRDRRIQWLLHTIDSQSGPAGEDSLSRMQDVEAHLQDYADLRRRLKVGRLLLPLDRWLERTVLWRFKNKSPDPKS